MRAGWADYLYTVTSVSPTNITLAPCGGYSSNTPTGTSFYAYNVMSELDQPGEYVINRTSSMLYVWPPTPSFFNSTLWAAPRVAAALPAPPGAAGGAWAAPNSSLVVSVTNNIVQLNTVSYVTFTGFTFSFGRGVGVNVFNCSNVSLVNSVVENVGIMCVNVTGGAGVSAIGVTLRHCGAGGISLYGGNRQELTRSGHLVANSSISYANRYTLCYAPLVRFGECAQGGQVGR